MKNGQLAHELRRVGRRVRVVRAWKAFLWGLAAAGALSLAALTASFFTPMPKIGRIVLVAYGACMLLFPLAAALCWFTSLPVFAIYAIVQAADIIKLIIGCVLIKRGVWISNLVEQTSREQNVDESGM